MFGSGRERRLWVASLVWIVLIYGTLYFVRAPVEYLRGRNLLTLSVAAVFVSAAIAFLIFLYRYRASPPSRAEAVVLVVFAVLLFFSLRLTVRPEEKLHFLQYGVLGVILFQACRLRRERLLDSGGDRPSIMADLVPAGQAFTLAGLAGWGDEGIQHILPNRVYDLHDVLLNLVGGALFIAVTLTFRAVRRPD